MNRPALQLSVASDLKYLPAILSLVREFGRIRGLSDDKLRHLQSAVEEVVINAVQYAATPESESLQISCMEIPQGLSISVIDKGRPAIVDLTRFEHEQLSEEQRLEQLGVLLMSGMSDRIECRNLGMGGRELRIEFHLNDDSVADLPQGPSDSIPTRQDSANIQHWQPEDVRVDAMIPDDAIAVAECIFGSYGYTYPKEDLYYPERLIRLQQSGSLYCAVARMPDGVVAGTGIIDRNPVVPGLFEMEALTTRQEYRSLGVARKVADFLIEHEIRHDPAMDGLLMESVTNHCFSQKIARENDFSTTGFFFGLVPDTVCFKGMEQADEKSSTCQRVSSVLNVRRIRPWTESCLYVPEKHRKIIERIYSQFQAPFQLKSIEAAPDSNEHSLIDTVYIDKMGIGIVSIKSIGHDFSALLKQRIFQLKSRGVQVLSVYLNMLEPAAPWAAALLETHGFVFTGVLPGNEQFHPLLLQWFGGVTFSVDCIQVNDEVGRAVLQHVRKHDPSLSIA